MSSEETTKDAPSETAGGLTRETYDFVKPVDEDLNNEGLDNDELEGEDIEDEELEDDCVEPVDEELEDEIEIMQWDEGKGRECSCVGPWRAPL